MYKYKNINRRIQTELIFVFFKTSFHFNKCNVCQYFTVINNLIKSYIIF